MRGTVAKRLRAKAREIHSRPGRQQENKLVGVQVQRKANCLSRLRWERYRRVEALKGQGFPDTIAETMVPTVPLTAVIAVMTGPRATYQFLKKLHKEQRRSP